MKICSEHSLSTKFLFVNGTLYLHQNSVISLRDYTDYTAYSHAHYMCYNICAHHVCHKRKICFVALVYYCHFALGIVNEWLLRLLYVLLFLWFWCLLVFVFVTMCECLKVIYIFFILPNIYSFLLMEYQSLLFLFGFSEENFEISAFIVLLLNVLFLLTS